MARRLHVAGDVGVPEFIFQAAGVRREVAQGGPGLRRAQDRRVAVEAVEHLHVGELRQDVVDRRVETHLPAVDQDGGGDRADRLGHREDAEHRILAGRPARRGLAHGAAVAHPVRVPDHAYGKRYIILRHRPLQNLVHARHAMSSALSNPPLRFHPVTVR